MTRITSQLLLLLFLLGALVPQCLSHSLRAAKDHESTSPRKSKLPSPTHAEPLEEETETAAEQEKVKTLPIPESLEFYAQHPRDLVDIDEASIETRVVGGNTVTDYNRHPFVAEWHNQFCGHS